MNKPRLFLIDATALCYRAFYAIRGLSTRSGQPTNAVYGFVRMLRKILKDNDPEYLAVCFDVSRKTFRQEKYAGYKANRPAMPDELASQIALIKQIVAAYGMAICEKEGFEADDVIATLVRKARARGLASTIVTQDKDLTQLVAEDVVVLNPADADEPVIDVEAVRSRYSLEPEQITDLIALTGDPVDNIPGIKGLTEKRAVELLRKYGSIDGIFKNLKSVTPEKVRLLIEDNAAQIKLNRQLTALDDSVDIGVEIEALKERIADERKLTALFRELEFKAFLKDLPRDNEGLAEESSSCTDAELPGLLKGRDEIIVFACRGLEDIALGIGDLAVKVSDPGKNLKAVLADGRVKKTGCDLKQLKVTLSRQGAELSGLWFDAMIAAYLVDPGQGQYGLSELAWHYAGSDVAVDQLDSRQAVALIRTLCAPLRKKLEELSLEPLFRKTEMPLVEVLADMEISGIRLDLGLLEELSGQLQKRLAGLISRIYGICGCQFNINSPKQLREVLFERLKLPVVKKTKTGPSTDEEVLTSLAAKHELPAKLLEYRQLAKLKSTYIDALPLLADRATGRVHTSFEQTGTETGRLSSRSPNLQNMPIKSEEGRRIREAVIAFSEGSVLVSCDYSQIELRILAHLSGDKTLLDAFARGEDIHRKTSSLVNNVPEEEVTDEMRDAAKRINFGIIYGLSAYGLSRDLGIAPDQAQSFIDAYFAQYPQVKEYIDAQISRARREGSVKTILGRLRYVPDIASKNISLRQFAERQAVNTPIQGSASDLIKSAMVEIHAMLKERFQAVRMIMQIHDELVFDVPQAQVRSVVPEIKRIMEQVIRLSVALKVDVKVGRNWSQMEDFEKWVKGQKNSGG